MKINIIMSKYTAFLLSFLILASCNEKEVLSDAYGNFEATTTTISSEANGKLLFLEVQEGQNLEPGTLIALVDTTQLHLQRLQLLASIGTLPKKLRNAIDDIGVLQNQKQNLIRERDRVIRLVSKSAATTKQLDDLNGKIEVVDKQIIALNSKTELTNKAILSEKGPLLAMVAVVDEKIRRSYIRNPLNGTVVTKLAESHEMVGMGAPLYRIGQLDTLTFRFYVDAVQLQDLAIGKRIDVLIDEGQDLLLSLDGVVSWISEQAEFTPKTIQTKKDRVNLVYAIKALVPNVAGRLKMGMPGEVNFIPREESNQNVL